MTDVLLEAWQSPRPAVRGGEEAVCDEVIGVGPERSSDSSGRLSGSKGMLGEAGAQAEGLSCAYDGTFQNKRCVSISAGLETEHSGWVPLSGDNVIGPSVQGGDQGASRTLRRLPAARCFSLPAPESCIHLGGAAAGEWSTVGIWGTRQVLEENIGLAAVWKLTQQQ